MRLGILIVSSLVLAAARPGFSACGDQAATRRPSPIHAPPQRASATVRRIEPQRVCRLRRSRRQHGGPPRYAATPVPRRRRPLCRALHVRRPGFATCCRRAPTATSAAASKSGGQTVYGAARRERCAGSAPAVVTPVQRQLRTASDDHHDAPAGVRQRSRLRRRQRLHGARCVDGSASTSACVWGPAAPRAAAPGRRRNARRPDGSIPAAIRCAAATVIRASHRAAQRDAGRGVLARGRTLRSAGRLRPPARLRHDGPGAARRMPDLATGAKDHIRYLDDGDLKRLHDEVMRLRLATFSGTAEHLAHAARVHHRRRGAEPSIDPRATWSISTPTRAWRWRRSRPRRTRSRRLRNEVRRLQRKIEKR